MGYTVAVDLPHYRKVRTFSPNISHAAMRRALDALVDTLHSAWENCPDELDPTLHSLPLSFVQSALPGTNGTRMTWLECGVDAPKLSAALDLLDPDHPDLWVLEVVTAAACYAAANRGEVCFD